MRLQRTVKSLAAMFQRDERGTIAVMFAMTLVPLAGFVGVALDYNRASAARAAIHAASDAAVLAATRMQGASLADREAAAHGLFNAGINALSHVTIVSRQLEEVSANQWRYRVNARIGTEAVRIVGVTAIDIKTTSEAVIGAGSGFNGPLEFVIAHDITNSMFLDPAQMAQSVSAMQDFVDRAFANSARHDVIGSILPFSDRVRLPERANAWTTGNRPNGWQGCLEPREQTVGSRRHVLTDAPHSALSFSYFTPTTKTAAHSPGNSYTLGCFGSEITPADHRAAPLKDALASMGAGGSGRFDEAMAWAWRLLSPQWRNQWGRGNYPAAYGTVQKLAILVTDGRTEMYRYEVQPVAGAPTIYGWNLGTQEGFTNLEQVCTDMKAAGIRIVVVQLDGNPSATDHLRRCASALSDHYFITNIAQFRAAFANIGGGPATSAARLLK